MRASLVHVDILQLSEAFCWVKNGTLGLQSQNVQQERNLGIGQGIWVKLISSILTSIQCCCVVWWCSFKPRTSSLLMIVLSYESWLDSKPVTKSISTNHMGQVNSGQFFLLVAIYGFQPDCLTKVQSCISQEHLKIFSTILPKVETSTVSCALTFSFLHWTTFLSL